LQPNDKNNAFNNFQQYVATILASPCKPSTPPGSGFGQLAKEEER